MLSANAPASQRIKWHCVAPRDNPVSHLSFAPCQAGAFADPKRAREGLPSEKVFAVQERARTFVIYNQTAGKLGIAATGVWFARKNAYLLVASSRENLMELHQM